MYVPNADFFQLGDLDCAEDSARGQGTGGEGFFPAVASLFWSVERESNSVSCRSGNGAVAGHAAGYRSDMKVMNMVF